MISATFGTLKKSDPRLEGSGLGFSEFVSVARKRRWRSEGLGRNKV